MNAVLVGLLLVCILIVLAFAFDIPQMLTVMYVAKQYQKAMGAWYQRTNPDDPMPHFSIPSAKQEQEDSLDGKR